MFSEDLDEFLDSDDGHALDATYDGATAVKVILDAEYGEDFGIAGTLPTATGKASTFPPAAVGKTLLIGATTYVISGREPVDDGAFVKLRLQLAS